MRIKDLVMRTLTNDVKILILVSKTMCSDYKSMSIISILFSYTCTVVFSLVDALAKLNNKHFMWRFFYLMRQDMDACAEGSNNKVIDIEKDMKVGENVGRLNIIGLTTNF
ncbi:hypothetical protein H5410_060944 [Solanum commersonii]|uniref:Uncharacterized protein n=1 Tax=Solanum commersonii TaxID=4109 RepID=A0A9J5W6L6_SOLCO|nr:hypothetical protein H5410_060944 [Solanum commersonii]